MIWIYTILAVVVVSLISFIGVFALAIKKERLEHILLYMVSFSVGALLGDVFLHLMPELIEEAGGFPLWIGLSFLLGVILFFIVEKFVHWHHCHKAEHSCETTPVKPMAYTILIGDAFHNFLDGAIIAGSFLVSVPLGIVTTLAVVFHEIPSEIGDFGVLLYSGMKVRKALWFNFLSALTAVLGAVVTLILARQIAGIEMFLLALAGGGFIYIAGSDLIPELHKKECKVWNSTYQLLAIVLGIGVMVAFLFLE